MKIMLLEDDVALNQTIVDVLTTLDHCTIDAFYDGENAAKSIANIYDLFIIDINVPYIDGIELLKLIKTHKLETPVLIISADTNIKTISNAYDIGCNDFIKKPFHVEELLFKTKQFIKNLDMTTLGDNFKYDMKRRKLYKNSKEIYLTKKEGNLLYLLLINRGDVVSNDMIQNFIYNNEYVSNDSQRALIKRLRKIIGKDTIINLTSQGYKINK